MALAFGAVVRDDPRTKIFTCTMLDNDAAADLVVDFSTVGFATDLPAAPIEYYAQCTASVADTLVNVGITAVAATGVTIRKLTTPGGAGANSKTFNVVVRATHTIEQ